MAGVLAILAGGGRLPSLLSEQCPDAVRVVFDGVPHELDGPVETHRFEKMGGLFDALRTRGVDRVVMAGAMARPRLDPGALDPFMQELAPRFMAAMQGGDDALLRFVIDIFQAQGFTVLGAHEVVEGLTADAPSVLTRVAPDEGALRDIARGREILATLSPLDIGQGVVVAGGLCLGVETLQGTEAMLAFAGQTPAHLRRNGGVFVKCAKLGQDMRVDMPAIGPETAGQIADAGLVGAAIEVGRVMMIDRAATIARFDEAGLFLVAIPS